MLVDKKLMRNARKYEDNFREAISMVNHHSGPDREYVKNYIRNGYVDSFDKMSFLDKTFLLFNLGGLSLLIYDVFSEKELLPTPITLLMGTTISAFWLFLHL